MVVVTAAAGFLLAAAAALSFDGLGPAGLDARRERASGGGFRGPQPALRARDGQPDAAHRQPAAPPTSRIGPEAALAFALGLVLLGLVALADLLTASLGAPRVAGYVFVYTPIRRLTSLHDGGGFGALPDDGVGGAGRAGPRAWALWAYLLLAGEIRASSPSPGCTAEDYAQGGFPDADGAGTRGPRCLQMILWGAALVPVSLLPSVLGMTDRWRARWDRLSASLPALRPRDLEGGGAADPPRVGALPAGDPAAHPARPHCGAARRRPDTPHEARHEPSPGHSVACSGACSRRSSCSSSACNISSGSAASRTRRRRCSPTCGLPAHQPGRPAIRLDGSTGCSWVADFIFTRCPGPCPLMTPELPTELGEILGVRRVTFTVDPEHDTPAVCGPTRSA